VVVLSAYLLYRGSGLSQESDDEIEASLQRIHEALARKEQQPASRQPAPRQS
jgi:hypothetical protein